MTDVDGVLMGRAELERAFTALGERLARRGTGSRLASLAGDLESLRQDAALNGTLPGADLLAAGHFGVSDLGAGIAHRPGRLAGRRPVHRRSG